MTDHAIPDHVAVVGGGMSGLATAWYLQERGVEVTVLERTEVAAGSSWGNAGWLTPALTLPLSEPSVLTYGLKAMLDPMSPLYIPLTMDRQLLRFLTGFARHCTPGRWREAMEVFTEVNQVGMDAYDELEAGHSDGRSESRGAVEEPTRPARPFLAAFASEKGRRGLVHEFDGVERAGGKVDYELLTGAEVRAFEPTLTEDVAAGVAIHGQRFINPPRYMASLAASVRERGGTVLEGVDVADVRRAGRGVELFDGRGRPVLRADHAVLATGAWLGGLARRYGVRQVVQAGRGYSFTVVPESMPTHPIYFPAQRVACTPLGDRFRVAGMMEFRDADAPFDPRRVRAIIGAVRSMYQGIDWEGREEEWVGSRPCTADGLPLIGRTREERISVAGGHGMWGVALGPLTGKMLAAELTGGHVPDVMRHFDRLR